MAQRKETWLQVSQIRFDNVFETATLMLIPQGLDCLSGNRYGETKIGIPRWSIAKINLIRQASLSQAFSTMYLMLLKPALARYHPFALTQTTIMNH